MSTQSLLVAESGWALQVHSWYPEFSQDIEYGVVVEESWANLISNFTQF